MRRILRALVAATTVVSVVGPAAAASAAPKPKPKPAVVSLDGTGMTGGWDGTTFQGTVRCRAGAVDPRLTVSVTQGETVGSTVMSSVTCDGKSHRFSIDVWPNNASRFDVGNAWVEARLVVRDPKTGAELPAGTDANNVWIRPSGKMTPVRPIVINPDGTMTVRANALCRGPWFVRSLNVEVGQPGFSASGYLDEPDVPCDGKTHRVQFTLQPPEGKSFVAKPSEVDMYIDIMDPIHFDPIDQWWWRGTVSVVRR